jgi:hypothetical protein
MIVEPWIFEMLLLGIIGASGIGAGILAGWRHTLLLASMAIIVSAAIRVVTTLITWSSGLPDLSIEAWWIVSVVVGLGSGIFALYRSPRAYLQSWAIFLAFALTAITMKYLFGVGERHHSDSAKIVEISLLIFQAGRDPKLWELEEKRGFAYPLMLALGQDGRIFSSLTPLIFFSLIGLTWWLARRLTRGIVPLRWQVSAGVVVLVFFITLPIFRAAVNYLNSHTLLSLAILGMVGGWLISEAEGTIRGPATAMIILGSAIGATARVEGILFVAIVLAAISSSSSMQNVFGRSAIFLSATGSAGILVWWLASVGSEVPERFRVSTWMILAVSALVAGFVASPPADKIRWFFFPLALAILIAVLIQVALGANSPLTPFMTQFNNVVRGYGGWGVAGLTLATALILLGWRNRSTSYRKLAALLGTLLIGTLVAKLFDGDGFGGTSFGRDGFYDSVNRMWLHSLGVALLAMTVGLGEFFRAVARNTSDSLSGQLRTRYGSREVVIWKGTQR